MGDRYTAYVDGRACHNCGEEPYKHLCAATQPAPDALREALTALLRRWEADRWEDAVWGEAYVQLEDALRAALGDEP